MGAPMGLLARIQRSSKQGVEKMTSMMTNRPHQKGQSIIEISLITPLLLIALYIPADFGVAFYLGNLTQNAAREGARIGSGLSKSGSAPSLIFSSTQAIPSKQQYLADCRAILQTRALR